MSQKSNSDHEVEPVVLEGQRVQIAADERTVALAVQVAKISTTDIVTPMHRDRPTEPAQRIDELTVASADIEHRSRRQIA